MPFIMKRDVERGVVKTRSGKSRSRDSDFWNGGVDFTGRDLSESERELGTKQ